MGLPGAASREWNLSVGQWEMLNETELRATQKAEVQGEAD